MNIDTFMYFNEDDLLKIRLREHNSFIDKFIIIELDHTHSGKPKAKNFNLEKYKEFEDKIVYKFLDAKLITTHSDIIPYSRSENIRRNKLHWEHENFQRNYSQIILRELQIQPEDIILSSDLDEILDERSFHICVQKLKNEKCPKFGIPVAKVRQRHRYYKLNYLGYDHGFGPKVLSYQTYKSLDPSLLREYDVGFEACEGGWHFSYLSKSQDNIFLKMKSFSHAYQQDDVKDSSDALRKLSPLIQVKEEINSSYPKEILENLNNYLEYIV